jgi:hypothetical protein
MANSGQATKAEIAAIMDMTGNTNWSANRACPCAKWLFGKVSVITMTYVTAKTNGGRLSLHRGSFQLLAMLCVKDVGVHIGDPLSAVLGYAKVVQCVLDIRTNGVPIETSVILA